MASITVSAAPTEVKPYLFQMQRLKPLILNNAVFHLLKIDITNYDNGLVIISFLFPDLPPFLQVVRCTNRDVEN